MYSRIKQIKDSDLIIIKYFNKLINIFAYLLTPL